jgi:hypothetical protein
VLLLSGHRNLRCLHSRSTNSSTFENNESPFYLFLATELLGPHNFKLLLEILRVGRYLAVLLITNHSS